VNTSEVPIDNPSGWLVDEEGIAASSPTLGTPAYMLPKERGELHILARSIEGPLALHLAWVDVRGSTRTRRPKLTCLLSQGPGAGVGVPAEFPRDEGIGVGASARARNRLR
jgi:hypothetical protein